MDADNLITAGETLRPGRAQTVQPLLLVVQVWGRLYTRLMIEATLPSLATPGNLGACAGELLILTTPQDADTIRAAAIFRTVEKMITVRFETLTVPDGMSRYTMMSECHRRAARRAADKQWPAVYLSPDIVVSEGAIARLCEHVRNGIKAVVLPGLRVTIESFLPALQSGFPARADGSRPVGANALLGVALPRLNPLSQSLFWDAQNFTLTPTHIYWRVGDQGFVGMCAHLHPILVNAPTVGDDFHSTIDDDYLMAIGLQPHEIHVVTDSDEILVIEMSSRARFVYATRNGPAEMGEVVRFFGCSTNALHRTYMKENFLFHTGPVNESWTPALQACDAVRQKILGRIGPGSVATASQTLIQPSAARKLLTALHRMYLGVREPGPDGPTCLQAGWFRYRLLKRELMRLLPAGTGTLLLADGGPLQAWIARLAAQRGYTVVSTSLRLDTKVDLSILEGEEIGGPYDVVLCLDFLEHAFDPKPVMAQLVAAMTQQGLLLCAAGFLSPREAGARDYGRFTAERLTGWLEALDVFSVSRLGGAATLLPQALIHAPRRALEARRWGKPLALILFPFGLVWSLVVNAGLPLLNRCDRTTDLYSHTLLAARRRRQS